MRHKRRFYSGGYRPSALDSMEFYARLHRETGDKAASEAVICAWLELAHKKEGKV